MHSTRKKMADKSPKPNTKQPSSKAGKPSATLSDQPPTTQSDAWSASPALLLQDAEITTLSSLSYMNDSGINRPRKEPTLDEETDALRAVVPLHQATKVTPASSNSSKGDHPLALGFPKADTPKLSLFDAPPRPEEGLVSTLGMSLVKFGVQMLPPSLGDNDAMAMSQSSSSSSSMCHETESHKQTALLTSVSTSFPSTGTNTGSADQTKVASAHTSRNDHKQLVSMRHVPLSSVEEKIDTLALSSSSCAREDSQSIGQTHATNALLSTPSNKDVSENMDMHTPKQPSAIMMEADARAPLESAPASDKDPESPSLSVATAHTLAFESALNRRSVRTLTALMHDESQRHTSKHAHALGVVAANVHIPKSPCACEDSRATCLRHDPGKLLMRASTKDKAPDYLFGDERSQASEHDEDISREQLQMIKARTMFQMTEEIACDSTGGRKRLLFLTNSQAELLAGSSSSLQKMLDALEIPKPKLVINLLTSQGFTSYCTLALTSTAEALGMEEAGLVPNRGPFLSREDEIQALEKLDHFMANVILPMAAQTQAIIICNAIPSDCVLSSSLTRMLSVHRARWGKDIPFTVLSVSGSINYLYRNLDDGAVWRGIRRASRAWRQRDRKLVELVFAKYSTQQELGVCGHCDLDPNAMIYLLVDTINAKKDMLGDRGPFNKLMNELLRHLATTLPSLTIKTGHSDKPSLEKAHAYASSLAVAMESMLSGSPLLFLDLRQRPVIEASDRQALISRAKDEYDKACAVFLQQGVAETFDAMSIAYFHDVLFGDADASMTQKLAHREVKLRGAQAVPLYEAIERAEEGRGATFCGRLAPATVQQINDTAQWLANKFFADAWAVLPESIRLGAAGAGLCDFASYYEHNISAMSVHIRTIMSGRNFHHLNLHDLEGASKLVGELVKLDRLPNETSLQGLLLLRSAWCEYDVAMHLASKYKLRSKLTFLVQLLVAWAMVVVGVLRSSDECLRVQAVPLEELRRVLGYVLFGLATFVTVLSALDALMNAKMRWRQLRSCACSLEAIIWCYRARVGRFQQCITDSARPEIELCDSMNAWRVELMSAADLQTTDLEKEYPPEVYKHHQYVGTDAQCIRSEIAAVKEAIARAENAGSTMNRAAEVQGPDHLHKLRRRLKASEEKLAGATASLITGCDDDHHSPVKPDAYIRCRIHGAMNFYRERLPIYSRTRTALRVVVVMCTAASSALAYLESAEYVIMITSLAGAVISWSEFSETGKKIERYTRAVRGLKMLLAWWDVLTDVEKAGTDNISKLIETSEAIIADERQAWQATANRLATATGRGVDGEAVCGAGRGRGRATDDAARASAFNEDVGADPHKKAFQAV
jgi:hypothetical protein